jgi:hypothetical protein
MTLEGKGPLTTGTLLGICPLCPLDEVAPTARPGKSTDYFLSSYASVGSSVHAASYTVDVVLEGWGGGVFPLG